MSASSSPAHQAWVTWLGAVFVILAFGAPLFLGLDNRDQHNDEASYSYGVQRILETGNWLTVRGTPTNMEFLEKPPLKFWLVAAGMQLGVLPQTDAGMRTLDAVFGALMFLYVYLLASRLRNPLAGIVAAFVLFTFDPLILDHGLRSNNMEAALVLAYCAGFYHFLAWCDSAPGRARPAHALAVGLAFVLGFMTKFVVIAFLPLGAVLLLLTHPHRKELLTRSRLTNWIWPATAATVLIAPWFLYQTYRVGGEFWSVILGQQVLQRMANSLDPSHVEPPSFYVTRIWDGFTRAGTAWLVAAALVAALISAMRRNGTFGRMVIVWGLIPLAAISVSHSKIVHYSYPFVPPLAIAAGWLVAEVARRLNDSLDLTSRLMVRGSLKRQLLVGAGLIALAIGGVTFATGRIVLHLPGGGVLSNGSLVRPLFLGGLLIWLGTRQIRAWALPLLLTLAIAIFPANAYADVMTRLRVVDRPLAAVNACLRRLRASGVVIPNGTALPNGYPPTHAYYYYLREFGPYLPVEGSESTAINDADLAARAAATPPAMLIFKKGEYEAWRERLSSALPGLRTITAEDEQVLVLPGTAAQCAGPALLAGAKRGPQ